jgi:hypothetical protein
MGVADNENTCHFLKFLWPMYIDEPGRGFTLSGATLILKVPSMAYQNTCYPARWSDVLSNPNSHLGIKQYYQFKDSREVMDYVEQGKLTIGDLARVVDWMKGIPDIN